MAARKAQAIRRGLNKDDPGGETITVTVTVNGIIDYVRSASITTEIGSSGNYRYTTDHGETVNHNRNQGYNELANKLL